MSSTVIKVENLSKQYKLGDIGTGSLGHDINRWWYKARGKENPYLKIGDNNDRTQKGNSDYVWALQDVNFEVKAGEVLGIIGRNGAGKSTLLKILSKTTAPTTGSIKIKGRIASLLEVGTGFHPDLSGRDNIYLNGAILGMTKREITSRFDQIVDFAGVERYIDTPVKRYSSGMYVRLAFAVAAHLEPEILIVDEVLAVGDAEFQKKCLGKMKDVSVNDGRTVLFVSHNMAAVKNLCNVGIVLENGMVKFQSFNMDECITAYSSNSKLDNSLSKIYEHNSPYYGNKMVRLNSIELKISSDLSYATINDSLLLNIKFDCFQKFQNFNLAINLRALIDDAVVLSQITEIKETAKGSYLGQLEIPNNFLNNRTYTIDLHLVENNHSLLSIPNIIAFEVMDSRENLNYYGEWAGYIRPSLNFYLNKI